MTDSLSQNNNRILIIDDNHAIHESISRILKADSVYSQSCAPMADIEIPGVPHMAKAFREYSLDSAYQGQEGLELVNKALAENVPYALAFVDMRMPPGWNGVETIRHLWNADPALQIVICTAYSSYVLDDVRRVLGETENLLFLKKPFDNIEVLQLVHTLTKKWSATKAASLRLADLDTVIRKRTAELRSSEERFSLAFQESPIPMAIHRLSDGAFVDINTAFAETTGHPRDTILNTNPVDLKLWPVPQDWTDLLEVLSRSIPIRNRRLQILNAANQHREVILSAQPFAISGQPCGLAVLQDITDQVRLESQLRQAQKMEAVGQLAAGVAHDFNNLLTIIIGYTTTAQEAPDVPEELRASLDCVTAAAERAASLTRQLLLFSRRQVSQTKTLEATSCILALKEMLRRLIGEHIELAWDCPHGLPKIVADSADIEQVIINLSVNARDAMPNGGRINVRLRTHNIDESNLNQHASAKPGVYLRLSVTDTGSGMDEQTRSHIFEPFFTTKAVGKGTGLGLSTVYAIVSQLGGWVDVQSELGVGSTFEVYIPAVASTVSGANSGLPFPNSDGKKVELGGNERVLLVEDDDQIRSFLTSLLTRFGYRVTAAPDGPSAIDAMDDSPEPFALLLTDMVMPNGITGAGLAAIARAKCPALKVVFMSGYSPELLAAQGQMIERSALIVKPFTHSKLLTTLREHLGDSTSCKLN